MTTGQALDGINKLLRREGEEDSAISPLYTRAAGARLPVVQALDYNRRDFLKTASAATLGALAAGFPRQVRADAEEPAEKIKATADTLIVLWMGGGMAHTETFDPKRYTPFEKDLDPNKVLSTFPSIDTAVDHIKLSEGLEKLAKVMDRGALIRTYTAGDLGFILHSRHQYQWHDEHLVHRDSSEHAADRKSVV